MLAELGKCKTSMNVKAGVSANDNYLGCVFLATNHPQTFKLYTKLQGHAAMNF